MRAAERAWARDLACGLQGATDVAQVGSLLLEHVQKVCGYSALNLLPLVPMNRGADMGFQWSEWCSVAKMRERMVEVGAASEKEWTVVNGLLSGERVCIDLNIELDPKKLRRSWMFEEWQERHVERQLLGRVGDAGNPLAVLCFARAECERPFGPEALAALELCCHALRPALARLFQPPPPWRELELLLNLVSQQAPFEGAVFDDTGRLVWLSEEAIVRFEICATRLGQSIALGDLSPALEEWRRAALSALRAGRQSTPKVQATSGLNERVSVTAFPANEGLRGLALVTPARSAARSGVPPHHLPGPSERLTSRQREVAMLAAKGYAALNISALTGLSPHTVRTHLKAIYKRLGVSNRAELALRLLAGSPERP